MPLCRVFQMPDGSLRVMHPNLKLRHPGESEADFCARICDADRAKAPWLATAVVAGDVDSATLPSRSRRHAWRVKNGKVVDDPTIPEPPDPDRELAAAIQNATTLDALKAALLSSVKAGRVKGQPV